MAFDGYILILILILVGIALWKGFFRPGLIFFTALIVIIILGIIDVTDAMSGFSNKGVLTVALLFLVAEGLRHTGVLNYMAKIFLPKKIVHPAILYLQSLIPVTIFSAFINSSAVVPVFVPIFKKWGNMYGFPTSKLLLPLAYAIALGGLLTLIGSSTTLILFGLMEDKGIDGIHMFEPAKVGVIICIISFIYLVIFGNMLLPGEKMSKRTDEEHIKEFYFDVLVLPGGAFEGKTVENRRIGLIKNLQVTSIEHEGKAIKTTRGKYKIRGGDRLLLAGSADLLEQIMETQGIQLSCLTNVPEKFHKQHLKIIEAVISPRFPGIDNTIGNFDFLSHYGAVIMAVNRNGNRIDTNLNNLEFKQGDNLILLATNKFIDNWGDSRVFYTTSYMGDISRPEKRHRMWVTVLVLLAMVASTALLHVIKMFDKVKFDIFFFSAVAVVALVWLGSIPAQRYTKAISWDMLISVACAIGIGKGIANTGVAEVTGTYISALNHWVGIYGMIGGIYLLTMLFNGIFSNFVSVAFVFPVATIMASNLGIDARPLYIAICIAAAANFTAPYRFQAGNIVQNFGNYSYADFLKTGLPLNVISIMVSVIFIPYFWTF